MKNTVTADSIEAKIAWVEYLNPESAPHMTLCIMGLKNGFVFVGQSCPADPANFDADLGRGYARADAVRQIWPMEGYLLRERLHHQNKAR